MKINTNRHSFHYQDKDGKGLLSYWIEKGVKSFICTTKDDRSCNSYLMSPISSTVFFNLDRLCYVSVKDINWVLVLFEQFKITDCSMNLRKFRDYSDTIIYTKLYETSNQYVYFTGTCFCIYKSDKTCEVYRMNETL